jgi:nicotinate phosphoribosyltransferase
LTDKYELTMLAAALRDGYAQRRTTFEVFARRLPDGRRYGVLAGTGRFLAALGDFVFDDAALATVADFCDPATLDYLRGYRFRGDIDGYAEGELYFPGSPVLSVTGTFAECVLLETLALSILNHDTAVASAAARMVSAADGRPLIEMGSRRTHEQAAVASARAAYIAGFTGTSNLAAQQRYEIPALGTSAHAFTLLHTTADGRPLIEMGSRRTHEQAAVAAARAAYIAGFTGTSNLAAHHRYGIPALGTSAHAFTLLHTESHLSTDESEQAAFRAQVAALGESTTLLVDTYDVRRGVANAIAAAGTGLGAVRIDSGDLGVLARQVREQLDALGATGTRIVVSGDLDEYAIAALRAEPVDTYGVGTSVVTGSGAPTASMVYKLVEVDGLAVQKRSLHKESHGGRKAAVRLARPSGTVVEELVHPAGVPPQTGEAGEFQRVLTVPLVRAGEVLAESDLDGARSLVAAGLRSLPWEGLALSHGEPAIPTANHR